MWNLKIFYKWTYLQNSNKVTYIENKLVVIQQEGRGGIYWDIGIDMHATIYKIDN